MKKNDFLQKFDSFYETSVLAGKDPDNYRYYFNSRERYRALISHFPETLEGVRFLDIGISEFTFFLKDIYTDMDLSVLDFKPQDERSASRNIMTIVHDLNSPDASGLPENAFDVVVFSEVLEHLKVSPRVAISKIARMLKPGGYVIITTPNVLVIGNRLKTLAGIHPLERVRRDESNPGHFREYCLGELVEYTQDAGLTVEKSGYPDFWNHTRTHLGLYHIAGVHPLKIALVYFPFVMLKRIIYALFPTTGTELLVIGKKNHPNSEK